MSRAAADVFHRDSHHSSPCASVRHHGWVCSKVIRNRGARNELNTPAATSSATSAARPPAHAATVPHSADWAPKMSSPRASA